MFTVPLAATFPSTTCTANGVPGTRHPSNVSGAAYTGVTPPVTSDEARAIAEAAAGGTALGVDQETEDGELLYEVEVQTASGRMEVEVRASDGGVVEIESEDDDDGDDDDDDDGGEDDD